MDLDLPVPIRGAHLFQEFILLSDVLGLSLLVDSIDHPKPPNSTEGTVLGPFHTHEVEDKQHGAELSHDPKGEPCLVICTVKDTSGKPVAGVKIDIWETDSEGFYDVQHEDRDGPDGRCVMQSDDDGNFWFKAILPVEYPIPHDGPVGQLLKKLHRHPYRPAHMHFMFEKPGWDHLITSVTWRAALIDVLTSPVLYTSEATLMRLRMPSSASSNLWSSTLVASTKLCRENMA